MSATPVAGRDGKIYLNGAEVNPITGHLVGDAHTYEAKPGVPEINWDDIAAAMETIKHAVSPLIAAIKSIGEAISSNESIRRMAMEYFAKGAFPESAFENFEDYMSNPWAGINRSPQDANRDKAILDLRRNGHDFGQSKSRLEMVQIDAGLWIDASSVVSITAEGKERTAPFDATNALWNMEASPYVLVVCDRGPGMYSQYRISCATRTEAIGKADRIALAVNRARERHNLDSMSVPLVVKEESTKLKSQRIYRISRDLFNMTRASIPGKMVALTVHGDHYHLKMESPAFDIVRSGEALPVYSIHNGRWLPDRPSRLPSPHETNMAIRDAIAAECEATFLGVDMAKGKDFAAILVSEPVAGRHHGIDYKDVINARREELITHMAAGSAITEAKEEAAPIKDEYPEIGLNENYIDLPPVNPWRIGEQVAHKTTGLRMTIDSFRDQKLVCRWTKPSGLVEKGTFDKEDLIPLT